jgi:hypothetical protein
MSSLCVAEVYQRSPPNCFILKHRVAKVDLKLLLGSIHIVIKVQLHEVRASDGFKIENADILVDFAAIWISIKSQGVPRHCQLV